jgi:cell division protein FtsB
MFPPMEMDEHREERKKLEARIAQLQEQLQDYATKIAEGKSAE